MFMKKLLASAAVISLMLGLTACQSPQSQNTYDSTEAGKQTDIEYGVIKSIKHVKVQSQSTGVGAIGGAATGGVLGSTLGGGKGAILTAIGGALAGGLAGNAVENSLDNKVGIQYIIKKDNGKTVSIVQNIGKDDQPLKVGQHVMIQSSGEYQEASGRGVAGAHNGQYQRVLPVDDSDDNGQ
jgi:outer membrane lipoprotein SlyB